jgi:hypothetical protein
MQAGTGALLRELDMALFLAVFGVSLVVGLASWAVHRDKVVAAIYLARIGRGSCGAGRPRGAAPDGAARVYSAGPGGSGRRLPAGSRFWSAGTGVFETDAGGTTVDCSCAPLALPDDKEAFFVRLGAAWACGAQRAEAEAEAEA